MWAEATLFLEEFRQALTILEEGLTATGDPVYKSALAQAHVTWFDHVTRQGIAAPGQRLKLVEIGLRWDPKNLAMLDRLLIVAGVHQTLQASVFQAAATFGMVGASSPREAITLWVSSKQAESDAGTKMIDELLDHYPSPQTHFMKGVFEHQRGNLKEARFHWERAYEGNPDIPAVVNNLAYVLMQMGDLPKALDFIEIAVKMNVRDPNAYDTRGRICVKMGIQKADRGDAKGAEKDFRQAVKDMEYALPTSPIKADLQRALADAYRRLGMHARAEEYDRAAADEKSPKQKAGPR